MTRRPPSLPPSLYLFVCSIFIFAFLQQSWWAVLERQFARTITVMVSAVVPTANWFGCYPPPDEAVTSKRVQTRIRALVDLRHIARTPKPFSNDRRPRPDSREEIRAVDVLTPHGCRPTEYKFRPAAVKCLRVVLCGIGVMRGV